MHKLTSVSQCLARAPTRPIVSKASQTPSEARMTRAPERGTRTCTPAMHGIATRPFHSADKPAVGGGSPPEGATGTEVAVARHTHCRGRQQHLQLPQHTFHRAVTVQGAAACLPRTDGGTRWLLLQQLAAETARQQTHLADMWKGDDGCANVKVPHCAGEAQSPRPNAQRPRALGAGSCRWSMGCSTGQHCSAQSLSTQQDMQSPLRLLPGCGLQRKDRTL